MSKQIKVEVIFPDSSSKGIEAWQTRFAKAHVEYLIKPQIINANISDSSKLKLWDMVVDNIKKQAEQEKLVTTSA